MINEQLRVDKEEIVSEDAKLQEFSLEWVDNLVNDKGVKLVDVISVGSPQAQYVVENAKVVNGVE